jgi:uncharacterized membrane protein
VPAPPLPKGRLEALTDGIFAVTMTLLVLDIRFPAQFEPGLGREVLALVSLLDNYVISFAVLAVFWLGHLRLMRRLRDPDAAFVAQNLAFLFLTTLVPPLTALLGNHPELPRAAVLYGANLFLLLCLELAMWRRVCLHLGDDSVDDPRAAWLHVRSRYAFGLAVVLLAIVVALAEIAAGLSEGLAPWLYLLLLGLGTLRPRVPRSRPPPR